MKKVIIVGANACGGSTASRLRRLNEDIEIILIDRGNYMSFANCGLPYYIGGEVKDLDAIDGQNPQRFAKENNIDVRLNNEVIAINKIDKTLIVYNHNDSKSYEESYDELVLAIGAELSAPEDMDLNKKNIFPVLSIDDAKKIDEYLKSNKVKTALVMGGGYIGMEMIEQLHNRNLDISLVTHGKQVLNVLDLEMANIVHKKLFEKGVQLFFESNEMPFSTNTDIVVVSTGIQANILLARMADLELGEHEGVLVNDYLKTSDEHIWAGGDLIEVKNLISGNSEYIPLAGPANRHGHIIADNILGAKIKYQPTLGTSILKIFELSVAMTGINERKALELGIDYEAIYIHAKSHAGYYPGAKPLTIKVLFAKDDYRILGAQIIGEEGVDKRIDVISTAIQAGIRADQLDELELAYSPQFGSAKDPVNIAGMVASNIKNDLVKQIQWHELDEVDTQETLLIDLRPSFVKKDATMKDAIQLPFDKLREAMPNEQKDREIILFCGDGALAYDAYRMLELHGFKKLKILAGGLKTYADAHYLQNKQNSKNLLGNYSNTVLV